MLCAFLSCVDKTFSLSCTLCSSWASLLSETFPLWASLCVGRHVCKRPVGGRRPAANSTYCCIAGARLSGSLPAIWLKGFVWHFRGSQSYPSCLTLGLWSMCVSIWWVAKRQPCEPLLNLSLLLTSLPRRWQFIPIPVILPVPLTPCKGTSQVTLEIARFIFEVVHGEIQWPVAVVKWFLSVASHAPLWRSTFAILSWELRAASWRVGWWRLHTPGRGGEGLILDIPTVSSGEGPWWLCQRPSGVWLVRRVYMGGFTPLFAMSLAWSSTGFAWYNVQIPLSVDILLISVLQQRGDKDSACVVMEKIQIKGERWL